MTQSEPISSVAAQQLLPRPSKPTIVFDGACGMCRRTMRMVDAFDWLSAFAQQPYDEAVVRYPQVERRQLDEGIRVLFADGSVVVGIDAVRSIAMRTPLGALLAWTLYLPPVRWLGARAYRSIAARRRRDAGQACRLDDRPATRI